MPRRSVETNRVKSDRGWRVGAALGVGLALLLAGCGGESAWVRVSAPVNGAVSPGGVWVGAANEVGPRAHTFPVGSLRAYEHARSHAFEGRTLGYELTAEASGRYRFRWTTDNLTHHTGVRRFTGSVWTAGHFLAFSPGCDDGSCDLEDGDYVSGVESAPGGGERIDWDTLAKDGWDGFSFTVDDQPLYFQVNVDGSSRPELLELVTWAAPAAMTPSARNDTEGK
jgi:hypothetical protein